MASADIKVVLIGQKNVGKTACFNRLIYNDCPTSQMVSDELQ